MGTHGGKLFRDVGFATNVWELMGASCLEVWDFVTPVWEPMSVPGGLDVWDLEATVWEPMGGVGLDVRQVV